MADSFLDRWVSAWLGHVDVLGAEGEARLQAMLELMSDDVRYIDVPTGKVSIGHEGVRKMATGVSERFEDISLRAVSAQTDGKRYAIEYEVSISFGGGPKLVLPGVAVGAVGSAGTVVEHRDYYDRSRFPTPQ
jgi:hypothetical protein